MPLTISPDKPSLLMEDGLAFDRKEKDISPSSKPSLNASLKI
jgi:hypothetical protein